MRGGACEEGACDDNASVVGAALFVADADAAPLLPFVVGVVVVEVLIAVTDVSAGATPAVVDEAVANDFRAPPTRGTKLEVEEEEPSWNDVSGVAAVVVADFGGGDDDDDTISPMPDCRSNHACASMDIVPNV